MDYFDIGNNRPDFKDGVTWVRFTQSGIKIKQAEYPSKLIQAREPAPAPTKPWYSFLAFWK